MPGTRDDAGAGLPVRKCLRERLRRDQEPRSGNKAGENKSLAKEQHDFQRPMTKIWRKTRRTLPPREGQCSEPVCCKANRRPRRRFPSEWWRPTAFALTFCDFPHAQWSHGFHRPGPATTHLGLRGRSALAKISATPGNWCAAVVSPSARPNVDRLAGGLQWVRGASTKGWIARVR